MPGWIFHARACKSLETTEKDMNTAGFTGFSADGLAFLKELMRLQDDGDFDGARDFFTRNKTVHERELKLPMGLLMEELASRLKAKGIPLRGDRKSALFRINRDVRFSRDKSPYKTHSGAVLTPTGSRKDQGVLYMHVSPAGCLMAAGFYRPEPGQLARLRAHVRDNPEKFRNVVMKLAQRGMALDADDTLKRLPRGFEDVEEPDIAAAVKLKGYTVMTPLETQDVMDAALLDKLEEYAGAALPLLEFGWEALEQEQEQEET